MERNLAAMAGQKADFEHIIQDGGSVDNTRLLVEKYAPKYNVKFYQEPDKGIYDAIAKGMAKAQGEILGWLGSDDYYLPWALSTAEAVFAKFPDVDWITSLQIHAHHDGRIAYTVPYAPVYPREFIRRGWYRPGWLGTLQQECMFWRRSLWAKANAPEVIRQYRIVGDYYLWKAFAEHAPLRTVSCALAVYSVSPQQSSVKHVDITLKEYGLTAAQTQPYISRLGRYLNRGIAGLGFRSLIIPDTTFWPLPNRK